MDVNRWGAKVKRGAYGPATESLSREGLDHLVDDAIQTLGILDQEISRKGIREYVEVNVRINVEIGRYLAPSSSVLEDALNVSRLETKCAEHFGTEADVDGTPTFRR